MSFPQPFISQMQDILGDEASAFFDALQADSPTSIRLNPAKPTSISFENRVAWSNHGYYLRERPTFTLDPLFHAGTYYVQEAASMFVERAINQLLDTKEDLNVLDLCAAPGGKSTHLLSLLPESSLLVSNEIIRSRANILYENICKWGYPNAIVTNNAPKDFAHMRGFFDVILVDAPCSGEGMFRKYPDSVSEWSENNVTLCAERQREILADVLLALKQGGLLIYSTCTYNRKENEDNARWLKDEFKLQPERIVTQKEWGIAEVEEDIFGYHFYPHKTKSEGFFLSAFIKGEEVNSKLIKHSNQQAKNLPKEFPHLKRLIRDESLYHFSMFGNKVKALPLNKASDYRLVESNLYILHSGIELGEIKGRDFIPSPCLALSTQLSKTIYSTINVNLDTALTYLRCDAISVRNVEKGFVLVCHNNTPLGWLKNIGNRTNNLYPNEWRIRMR
ncbi:MAG: rRNA cytosine-C5-methyltransferase [Prevotellaceae bacterium]|jgi:16S rRNA C967 or C1407 C5-methylase (RsmB/RsmF family)/NOL1/NOP2/fmu family ribosome biogenesis protein|nr:rRNA cytosine-C5-methyltransferase [Prevotellaceae bacterium]